MLSHQVRQLRSDAEVLTLANTRDQIHRLTSIFSGIFKMENTEEDQQVDAVTRVLGSILTALSIAAVKAK